MACYTMSKQLNYQVNYKEGLENAYRNSRPSKMKLFSSLKLDHMNVLE